MLPVALQLANGVFMAGPCMHKGDIAHMVQFKAVIGSPLVYRFTQNY